MVEREPSYVRMDFVQKVISMDEATRFVHVIMEPDPRRYSKFKRGSDYYYQDKFLNTIISQSDLFESLTKAVGVPVYADSPHIDNTRKYATDRRDAINRQLSSGVFEAPTAKADRHKALEVNKPGQSMTFVSVDICGSTKLRAEDAAKFDEAYKIFLQELGSVVGQFHGSILDTTGDGFIAFLDGPSINNQCDNAIDMGLSFIEVLITGVNPALRDKGLPKFSIRVGADHGSADITLIAVPTTGFQKQEIKSDALNRSVKIQAEAQPNEMLIGREMYERVHVQWLQRCEEQKKNISQKLGFEKYEIYSIS